MGYSGHSLLKRRELSSEGLTLMIFDAPEHRGPYDQRLSFLKSSIAPMNAIKVVNSVVCSGKNHLLSYLEEILTKGGEGLVIRNPNAKYAPGRSNQSLKVKVSESLTLLIRSQFSLKK